ncbi:MAG: PQQ-binding-like beta-propeller repeat protein [Deltaproteobacteria bacterium]|jgi:outer membrane protein assembly factor BamB|nr:PQQ-binding-like beta-propeller repeat protein [Deltaproteobacteria bacterium]
MAYGERSRSAAALVVSIVLTLLIVLPVSDAYARYKPKPKRHFLSWESLKRPEEYKKLKRHTLSDRRFDISKRRVVKLKKNSFMNFRPYQFTTPTIIGDKMFIGVDAGYFYGINARLKEKIWTFRTEGAVQGAAATDGNTVYATDCKGYIYALDANYGKEKWKSLLDTSIMSKPLIDGDRLYVVTMSGRLYTLDRNTGIEIWHTNSHERNFGFSVRRSATPTIRNGLIYVGTSSGTIIAYHMSNGSVAWVRQIGDRREQLYDVDGTPIFIGDSLYVTTADGRLSCLNASTGRVLWYVDAGGSNDPLYYDGKLYVTGGGTLSCLDPHSGHIYWQQDLDEPGLSSPAAGDNYIAVASTTDRLFLIDSNTGDVAFERYIRKGSFGDPVVIGDLLYILSNSGRMFTFKVRELKKRTKSNIAKKADSQQAEEVAEDENQ